MAKKTATVAPTNWHQYVHEHGLSALQDGNQSRTFRSGEVVVKVPRRTVLRSLVRAEMWWHRTHKDGLNRLGELAIPFEHIEENLRIVLRKRFLGLVPYDNVEDHSGYVVQVHTGDEPTLFDRLKNLQFYKKGLADLIELSRRCLTHGVYLHDMNPDNFVYWHGSLRLRDIGAVATDIDQTRELIAVKRKFPETNSAYFTISAAIRSEAVTEANQVVAEFRKHMDAYLSLESIETMCQHQRITRVVPKVRLKA